MPTSSDTAGRADALLEDLWGRMALIRDLELEIARLYPEQEMRCPTHLSVGQEAVAAGVCAATAADDAVFLNHRCHAAYIAKGGDLGALVAELYGKRGGCTRGRGGSMHLVDPEAGILGTSAILAGTIPIACGAAFAFARQGKGRAAVCFFGDAAVEEGTFFESLNMAALWKLPVLFVCENNGLSTCTPIAKRQATAIAPRAEALGVRARSVDGNDVLAVFDAASRALARARRGEGPGFLECATYRWLEHVGPNFDWDLGYRTKAEVEGWMARCPLKRFEERLDAGGRLPAARRAALREDIRRRVAEAVRFARESPFPEPRELLENA